MDGWMDGWMGVPNHPVALPCPAMHHPRPACRYQKKSKVKSQKVKDGTYILITYTYMYARMRTHARIYTHTLDSAGLDKVSELKPSGGGPHLF